MWSYRFQLPSGCPPRCPGILLVSPSGDKDCKRMPNVSVQRNPFSGGDERRGWQKIAQRVTAYFYIFWQPCEGYKAGWQANYVWWEHLRRNCSYMTRTGNKSEATVPRECITFMTWHHFINPNKQTQWLEGLGDLAEALKQRTFFFFLLHVRWHDDLVKSGEYSPSEH